MTITPDKIMAALHQRLEETFPGEPVYEHLTLRDFQRPCNLLELVRTDLDPQSMGMAAVTLRDQFRITTFTQTDEVHDSHLPVLDLRAMMVLAAGHGGGPGAEGGFLLGGQQHVRRGGGTPDAVVDGGPGRVPDGGAASRDAGAFHKIHFEGGC